MPLEEASDSSDNSSSLTTNLSMEKMHTLNRDVETSDSSEDEYIPLGLYGVFSSIVICLYGIGHCRSFV